MVFKWWFYECEKQFHLRIIGENDEGGIWSIVNSNILSWGPTFAGYISKGKDYDS